MSEILDRAFPPEQCLSEEVMTTAEQTLQRDIVRLSQEEGPLPKDIRGHAHLQMPFLLIADEAEEIGVNYPAPRAHPDEFRQLREKLSQ